MKTEINKDQIVKIEQYGFKKLDIKWRESSFFGLFAAGYRYYGAILNSKEDYNSSDLVEFNAKQGLYEKPYLWITTSNSWEKKIFETEEEMFNWREKNLKGIKLIEL